MYVYCIVLSILYYIMHRGKIALKEISKKLVNKNPNVVIHTLTVLETLAKNCGAPVQSEIATVEFMESFKKLIHVCIKIILICMCVYVCVFVYVCRILSLASSANCNSLRVILRIRVTFGHTDLINIMHVLRRRNSRDIYILYYYT